MAGEESGGGSGLLVLGRNRKYNPDKSQAPSQNKAISSFEHSHKDSAASAACLKTARQGCWIVKVTEGKSTVSAHI